MGMTPLEGLMMGTRAGSFDPGVMLKLLRDERLTLDQPADALAHQSGLLGGSGFRRAVGETDAAAPADTAPAARALQMFARRTAGYIAAAATSLPRLDAL